MVPSRRTALGLVLVGFVALLLLQGVCTQEDAFISFRYARHLVSGHGLVYNPGERVEGYTNFLWTLLMAAGMAAGIDPVPWSRWLGIAAALALVLFTGRWARREGNATSGALAAVLVAAVPGMAAEAVQGLETVPFALLVAAGVRSWVVVHRRWRDGSPWRPGDLWPALLLWLAALTRPEGLGVAGLCLLGSWWEARGAALPARRRSLALFSLVLLLYLPYWFWRLHYYGDPLPNTFYAKTGGGLRHLVLGLHYLGRFLVLHPSLTLLGVGAVLLARRRAAALLPGGRVVLVVLLGYAAEIAAVGGDFKETFRFVLPLVPLGAVLAAVPVAGWWSVSASRVRWTGTALLAVALLGVAPTLRRTVVWSRLRADDLERRTVCGLWLRDHARPGAVLAIHSAGIVPYYSGLRTIDMWGLTDRHIARAPLPADAADRQVGHERSDDAYVLSRRPDYIVPYWWLMVTDRPRTDHLDDDFRDLPQWREAGREYRPRSVPLPPSPRRPGRPRWFNFLQRIAPSDTLP